MTKLLIAGFDSEIVEVLRHALSSSGAEAINQRWGYRTHWLTGRDYFKYLEQRALELHNTFSDVYEAKDEQAIFKTLVEEKPEAVFIHSSIWASNIAIIERIRRNYDRLAILVTGYGFDDQTINYTLELGADDYITFPFGPRQLRARIKRIMEGKA